MTLASRPGRGSAFSVAVPGAPLRPVVEIQGEAPRPATVPLAGLTVLAVDNEPAIVDGMRVLVGSWGCALHTAGSLSEALALVLGGQVRPDVIVADYHLDQGTGLDLIAGCGRRWPPTSRRCSSPPTARRTCATPRAPSGSRS